MADTDFISELKFIPPIIMSPEVYGLPQEMDPMAEFVTRKGGGGLGDITRGIIGGLYKIGVDPHYIGPNYKKIFKEATGLSIEEYIHKMHRTAREKTHLVSTRHFSGLNRIYDGNVSESAASFQELAIPIIENIAAANDGKAIGHGQDQFTGIISAYCKSRGIPFLQTLHNGFTFFINHSQYHYADITDEEGGYKKLLFDTYPGSGVLDSHATAIKNADLINSVGKEFLNEIIKGRYDNWNIFANARNTFNEVKIKAEHGQARVVMNGISPEALPENQDYLKKKFGPYTRNIVDAKNENKKEFQKQLGLNVDETAILLYWPSRIDNTQKGIESLIGCALDILYNTSDVQIAIVGDAMNGNKKYEHQINNLIRHAPPGRIGLKGFKGKLSNLGYASASAVIGASHYEPFGLFWLQGVCSGAYGVGARNGGAVDILQEVSGKSGNGFLFENADANGLKYGLLKAINHIRELSHNPELHNTQLRRMMRQARNNFSEDKMVEGYLALYEELGIKYNMFTDGYRHFIPEKPSN